MVKQITKNVVLAAAVLHAKGYAHLDIKPENIMRVHGAGWKMIDVDGCVEIGSEVSIRDQTISFSPCYCAPEWANFLIEGRIDRVRIRDSLDVRILWRIRVRFCGIVLEDGFVVHTKLFAGAGTDFKYRKERDNILK